MKIINFIGCLIAASVLCSCNKYLDAKPDKALVVPASVQDFQAILDNTTKMNRSYPYSTELAADNIYITTADFNGRTTTERNIYTWGKDVFNDNDRNDWSLSYIAVYYANMVLDNADALAGTGNVKGQALFFRSFAFYELLQVFAQPYDKNNAASVKGIPLRLTADLNLPTTRAGLQQCYDRILTDTKKAVGLLPLTQLFTTRPGKAAAYALLARTYLAMSDYSNALLYADSALQLNNTLMDFNALNAAAAAPIPILNTEDLFHSGYYATAVGQSVAKMDSTLYQTYGLNDLRRVVFFKDNGNGSFAFKGSYDISGINYNGLATDEMYLIRAECFARAGNTNAAMNDLNTLLIKRWKAGTFITFTATDANDALNKILTERRKELLMRGLRWTDLRRLNKETAFATTLSRIVNGTTYTLPPNDPGYVFRIPLSVINFTGIEQNP